MVIIRRIIFECSIIRGILYLTLFLSVIQVACKTIPKKSFVKGSQERTITLSDISDPKVIFILQNKDTLKFNKYNLAKVIRKSPNYYSKGLSDSLTADSSDLFVYQNLSAVGNRTISGILDSWVARELLEDGKAEVMLTDHQTVTILRYVVTRDALGGRQGTFYGSGDRVIYSCIIAYGE
jgi:hypothetical protein